MSEILAKTKLVIDSATAILAPAGASTKPLIGCSPIAVAIPS
jgi:LDH2 family malate/lactate/ureidoglycolate dehydrogenase